MKEFALAVMDNGEVNKRILSRDENRADFRRVEAASIKRKTKLSSPEAKRLLARCFYSFQASVYTVSKLGRTKLALGDIEKVEASLREKLEAATHEMNQAIDGAGALLKANNIDVAASYETMPLEEEVAITSALGRRYFELIEKLDQLMPLLQTLEIEDVITEKEVEKQRSTCKRVVLSLTTSARKFAVGVRRRMNEADAKKAAEEHRTSAPRAQQPPVDVGEVIQLPPVAAALVACDPAGASSEIGQVGHPSPRDEPMPVSVAA